MDTNCLRGLKAFFDAGVNAINVSIDGLTPERFELITGKNRFEEVMDGLSLCQEIGFSPVKVNAVLLKILIIQSLMRLSNGRREV